MGHYLILAPVFLSFIILITTDRTRYYYVLAINLFIFVLTALPSVRSLAGGGPELIFLPGPFGTIRMVIDGLSGFFILVTNFTVLTGLLYSRGYLEIYRGQKNQAQLALHYFSYTWLHMSMLGVLMLRDGLAFLVSWELMAVASFMLILFEAEKRATLKTAVNYLVQMHVGLVFLVIAFLVCEAKTGTMSFDSLQAFFSSHGNAGLFFLFFAGFAIKAGFLPFHTWLPEAHPAAPTHVSGVMSGVMIKMGIYGIVRVLTYVQSDLVLIGWIVIAISVISGLMGVLMAIVQHDMKRLLAYHSIENIGIIGLGIGLGTVGLGMHSPMLAVLGFTGGLLHVLNHSLFKSLLFYATGSVYKQYHTRNLEELGGVMHRMPVTGVLYLSGAIAICGLPPLNGFISEFLIYVGLFSGLSVGSAYQSIALLMVIVSLVLIGGLAIFCFSKVFGVVFLGAPRQAERPGITEVGAGMLLPGFLGLLLIVLIGLLPMLFIGPLTRLVSSQFQVTWEGLDSLAPLFARISGMSLALILLTVLVYYVRKAVLARRPLESGPTWGCGYTAPDPRQQYTGTSYADSISRLAQPALQSHDEFTPIPEHEIFPAPRTFARHPADIIRTGLNRLLDVNMLVLKKLARLQTGNIQHYILYAFLFILAIFALLYLTLI